MAGTNGKPEVGTDPIDAEHELPPAAEGEDTVPGPAVSVDASPADSEYQKLKVERDNMHDRMLRMQAEFDNSRKRAVREQQEFRDFALADALKSLLPVLDSFERALQSSANEKSEFRNGVELIYRQLQDVLTKLGLSAVPAKGGPFDPRFHEAIATVDTDEMDDHHVLEELQRGYKLKERLLRPSMVKVARNPKS